MNAKRIKDAVRESYSKVAETGKSCCTPSSCCGGESVSQKVGYSPEELGRIPKGADLGLGCGNPLALAGLKRGEVVLDLGSGAGIDCFLAAHQVGDEGRVIGLDMTPAMLEKARENARKTGVKNVEFRHGEIEHMPVDDNSVDVVISNCVINLSPDKEQVFREMYRVLKPGGRFSVSDIILKKKLPDIVLKSMAAYSACVSGAVSGRDYIKGLEDAGFHDVTITSETPYPVTFGLELVASIKVEGRK